jgi:hypothetical protein
MKIYGGSGGIAPPFFTSALDGDEYILKGSDDGVLLRGFSPPANCTDSVS